MTPLVHIIATPLRIPGSGCLPRSPDSPYRGRKPVGGGIAPAGRSDGEQVTGRRRSPFASAISKPQAARRSPKVKLIEHCPTASEAVVVRSAVRHPGPDRVSTSAATQPGLLADPVFTRVARAQLYRFGGRDPACPPEPSRSCTPVPAWPQRPLCARARDGRTAASS